jgi:hypothetical protein
MPLFMRSICNDKGIFNQMFSTINNCIQINIACQDLLYKILLLRCNKKVMINHNKPTCFSEIIIITNYVNSLYFFLYYKDDNIMCIK